MLQYQINFFFDISENDSRLLFVSRIIRNGKKKNSLSKYKKKNEIQFMNENFHSKHNDKRKFHQYKKQISCNVDIVVFNHFEYRFYEIL